MLQSKKKNRQSNQDAPPDDVTDHLSKIGSGGITSGVTAGDIIHRDAVGSLGRSGVDGRRVHMDGDIGLQDRPRRDGRIWIFFRFVVSSSNTSFEKFLLFTTNFFKNSYYLLQVLI